MRGHKGSGKPVEQAKSGGVRLGAEGGPARYDSSTEFNTR
jgi:hypothetical protein